MATQSISYLSLTHLQIILTATGFFCFTMIANAQNNEEQDIREQRKKSNDAIDKHDTASLGQYWLDDIIVLTSRSTSLQGKSANLLAFQQEFQNKLNLVYERSPATIELFSPWNMASEYGRWTGTWSSNGATIIVKGSYYAKWHFGNGKWKIKSEIYVPTECTGGDYCNTQPLSAANGSALVVQNYYFPKSGKESEVIETRKRASHIRAQLGLPVGRILQNTSASGTLPYIIWECQYPSLKAREEDVLRIDKSAAFKEVQDHMSTLLQKFDRGAWLILQ